MLKLVQQDWRKPVNEGFEVFRLGDAFIIELKRRNHWVDFVVWEIACAENDGGELDYLDDGYQHTKDREASPPDISGHAKWDDEMCFHYPHRMRQIYGVGQMDREVKLIYWLVATLRNQFGSEDRPSSLNIPMPDDWPAPPERVDRKATHAELIPEIFR